MGNMGMKEIYYLNQNTVPTIPCPHDCIIKDIRIEKDCLVFVFEDDISYHDSIKSIKPNVKSLVMRFHLLNDEYDVDLLVQGKAKKLLHKPGKYKNIEIDEQKRTCKKLISTKIEYLYHNVGYCSIIVKLWSRGSVIFDFTVDYIELEWIELKHI